jgi:sugar phosphate permease
MDITLVFALIILEGATVFHYENVLSVYLVDTLGMSDDYLGYIFAIKYIVYGIMGVLIPKYVSKWFQRRTIILLGIVFLGIANAFMGST